MPKRVYGLKRATPRMKYQHMKMVLAWRSNIHEKQSEYTGNGTCPICKHSIENRPMFMVGEYDMCYPCYRTLEQNGICPPKQSSDLRESALKLLSLESNI